MGRILTAAQSAKAAALIKELNKVSKGGWLEEGCDAMNGAVGIFFNNDTDEYFIYDYNGDIIAREYSSITDEEAKKMAKIGLELSLI